VTRAWIPRSRDGLRAVLLGSCASLLDLLLPGRCAACGTTCGEALCAACLPQCRPPAGPTCERCGAPWTRARRDGACGRCRRFGRPFAFATAAGLWRYRGTVRGLVHAFKYRGRADLLLPLGGRLARDPRCAALAVGRPLVVAVPARAASRRRRGYDQARELAVGFARATGLPFDGGALRRRRQGGPSCGCRGTEHAVR